MKFSLGYNQDIKLLDSLGLYKDNIEDKSNDVVIWVNDDNKCKKSRNELKNICKLTNSEVNRQIFTRGTEWIFCHYDKKNDKLFLI